MNHAHPFFLPAPPHAKPPVSRCDIVCFSRQCGLFENAKQGVLQLAENKWLARTAVAGGFGMKVQVEARAHREHGAYGLFADILQCNIP